MKNQATKTPKLTTNSVVAVLKRAGHKPVDFLANHVQRNGFSVRSYALAYTWGCVEVNHCVKTPHYRPTTEAERLAFKQDIAEHLVAYAKTLIDAGYQAEATQDHMGGQYLKVVLPATPAPVASAEAEQAPEATEVVVHTSTAPKDESKAPKAAKTWNLGGVPGLVLRRRNRATGHVVSLYHAEQAGLDSAGGTWVVVCEEHHTTCNVKTIDLGKSAMTAVDFCEACQGTTEAE